MNENCSWNPHNSYRLKAVVSLMLLLILFLFFLEKKYGWLNPCAGLLWYVRWFGSVINNNSVCIGMNNQ